MNWENILKGPNEGMANRHNADSAIERSDGKLVADWIDRKEAQEFIREMKSKNFKITVKKKGAYIRVIVE